MPYITFSRKFDSKLARRLLKSIRARDSVVELRGTKTIRRIADRASSKGFGSALIISGATQKSCTAMELKVLPSSRGAGWRYGKNRTLAIK